MVLIEREALLNAAVDVEVNGVTISAVPAGIIRYAPTIDAAPVVYGQWEEVDWVEPDGHSFGTVRILKAGLRCNQCANVFRKKLLWKDNFCPNCGARMDGGEGHEAD